MHNHVNYRYGTAHVQVYRKTCAMLRDLKNFEDNWHIGLVRHEKYTARE